ncbi:growth-regulated alpha protein-like [Arapaima gigas]
MVLYTDQMEGIHVPKMCFCLTTADVIHNPVDFEVQTKGALCNTDQIIMTRKTNEKLCLNPKGKQGKKLLKCWNRIKKKGGSKKNCLKRKQSKKQGQSRRTKS